MISYFVTCTLNSIVNHACIFVLKIIFMYIIPFCYVCNVFKELQVCSAWGGYKDAIVQPLTQVVSQEKGIKKASRLHSFHLTVHHNHYD